MKLKIVIIGLVAVVLAAGGVAYAGSQVPFEVSGTATLTGSEIQPSIPELYVIKNEFVGKANGTQLGRCTSKGVQFFTVSSSAVVGIPIVGSFTQTETYTAANGDELVLATEGIFLVVPVDLGGPRLNFLPIAGQGVTVIKGGTSRFAGATGKATISTGLDDDFNVTFKMKGVISSLGSRGGNGKK